MQRHIPDERRADMGHIGPLAFAVGDGAIQKLLNARINSIRVVVVWQAARQMILPFVITKLHRGKIEGAVFEVDERLSQHKLPLAEPTRELEYAIGSAPTGHIDTDFAHHLCSLQIEHL